MPKIEELREQGKQTWKELYEGVEATDDKLQDLNKHFADFVQTQYNFSQEQRDDFEELLENLGKVSDHWDEINDHVDRVRNSLSMYSVPLTGIRDLFSDISAVTGGIGRRIAENNNLLRKVNTLATDAAYLAMKEEGLSTKIVKNHADQGVKLEHLIALKLKAAGASIDETRTLQSQSEQIREFAERNDQIIENLNQQLRPLEQAIRNRERLATVDRERYTALQKELHERRQLQEFSSQAAIQEISNLSKQLQLREQIRRSERGGFKGIPAVIQEKLRNEERLGNVVTESGDLINKPSQLSNVSKLLKAFGKDTIAEEFGAEVDKQISARISSLENYTVARQAFDEEFAKLGKSEQDQLAGKKLADEELAAYVRLTQELQNLNQAKSEATSEKQVDKLNKKIQAVSESLNPLATKAEAYQEALQGVSPNLAAANVNLNAAAGVLGDILGKGHGFKNIVGLLGKSLLRTVMKGLSGWAGALMIAGKVAQWLWRQLGAVTSEADKLKQHTGTWSIAAAANNDAFATSVQWLKTGVELAERFKINPVQLFSSDEIGKAAEVQNLLGLSAEQAANLAVRSKMAASGSDAYRVALTKGINAGNAAYKTAIGLGDATRDALNASDAITLSMNNNAEKIGKAAVAAASMGMELKDIEGITQNLINFESSIEAEMQAQLLTGRQLNLSKAREYALYNDLEGVTREINRQGIDAVEFGRMNYIQQSNLAKALGMSRDQMARMLVIQGLSKGLSAEALEDATHMTAEQIEALGVQERMKIAIDKLTQSLVPILEILVPIVEAVSNLAVKIAKIVGFAGAWGKKNPSDIPGINTKDARTTRQSSNWGAKLTPKRLEQEIESQLKLNNLTEQQRESLEEQLDLVREIRNSGLDRKQQEEEIAKALKVSGNYMTASMGGSFGSLASLVGALLIPRAINKKLTPVGRVVNGFRAKRGIQNLGKFPEIGSSVEDAVKASTAAKQVDSKSLKNAGKAMKQFFSELGKIKIGSILKTRLLAPALQPAAQAAKVLASIPGVTPGQATPAAKALGDFVSKLDTELKWPRVLSLAAKLAVLEIAILTPIAGFAYVLSKIGSIDWSVVAVAAVGISGLVGVAKIAGNAGNIKDALMFGAFVSLMAIGIGGLAYALSQFNGVEWSSLGKAAAAIVGLGALAALSFALAKVLIPGAIALGVAALAFDAALTVLAAGVSRIATAMNLLGSVNLSNLTEIGPKLVDFGKNLAVSGKDLVTFPVGTLNSITRSLRRLGRVTRDFAIPDFSEILAIANVSSGIDRTSESVLKLASAVETLVSSTEKVSLERLNLEKLQTASNTRIVPVEDSKEIQGIQKENLTVVAQEVTVKQVEAQRTSQQISIEQKSADLRVIEEKIDKVVAAIGNSRPDWDWLKFDVAYSNSMPWIHKR